MNLPRSVQAVNLPRSRKALSIATFDGSLAPRGQCELSRLRFVDAYGLVGTACALRVAHAAPVLLPQALTMRRHLSAMGFREFLGGEGRSSRLPDVAATEAPDVVVPLRSTRDFGAALALSNLLWEQLARHVDPQILNAVAEGVWELVANALEHSGSDALVMGQVYRTPRGTPPDHDDRVQVVVGDTGRGIRESFLTGGIYTPGDDLEAIELALRYLVSSVVDDPGRGQGLHTTMEQVAQMGGRMIVRSGMARVSITQDGQIQDWVPHVPGVIVALSLPLYPG